MDLETVLVPGANPVIPKTSAPGSSLWSLKTRQDGFAAIDGLPPETLDETKAAYWTLDTLVEAAQEMGIEVGRSQLRRILLREGVRWRNTRPWAESTDLEFVPKGRGSSVCTPTRRPALPWSAWTSSAP